MLRVVPSALTCTLPDRHMKVTDDGGQILATIAARCSQAWIPLLQQGYIGFVFWIPLSLEKANAAKRKAGHQ